MLGLLQVHPNPVFAESVASCGYDFLILDGEAGFFSESDFAQSLRTLATTNVLPMVRLAKHDPRALVRYLEMGADAIVVPRVETIEHAKAMVNAMPSGGRASLLVIIETALGASNAEAILMFPGVDAALVGPNDLTADLGCKGDYANSAYTQAVSHIEHAACLTGKALGTVPVGGYTLEVLLAHHYRLFILGTDLSTLSEAMGAQLTKARSICQQEL